MKIFIINREDSKQRKKDMKKLFPNDELEFFKAVDGEQWSNGKFDENKRQAWDEKKKQALIKKGILSADAFAFKRFLTPNQFALVCSTMAVYKKMLTENIDKAVILEDDVELVDSSKSLLDQIDMPEKADIYFLTGDDSPGQIMYTRKDGQIINGRCNFGYVITNEGAEKALSNMMPVQLAGDSGLWYLFNKIRWLTPKGILNKNILAAYAPKKAIIKTNKNSSTSTIKIKEEK